jgi:hypothetical protein
VSTTGTKVTLPEDRDARVPTIRLVQVEMRKMLDTRAGFWLLAVIVLLTTAAIVLYAIFAPSDLRTFTGFLQVAGSPQGFLLPVLGVLLVTSEWGQRAALTTFTLVPLRQRVLVSKVLAALVVAIAVFALAVLVAALFTVLRGGPDPWSGASASEEALGVPVAGALWRFGLLQLIGIVQGLAFGMLFLNSAAAIVTFFILPTISSLVFTLVPQLKDAGPWLDTGTAQAVLQDGSAPSGQEWAQLLTSTLLWVVLPLAVGVWRILRSEVK